ncbi:MAG: pantoate--beta-alanine ligase [Nitrospira sp.]|uniref:Pantothenate synthetase n=1 Tax=Nitrospira defluvii TaxID=330214 RepID=A0ABM8QKU9_9BACT|nr:pantoate--beta-alanine ligase [Nitrospira defluvii]MCS6327018.1 pantoate--beta-alanine ligase [Nitrospira sp.]CAE6702278.1 Pantothenate synthetase [Nitrospira defluvii]
MNTIRSTKAIAAWSRSLHREGVTIGFVPTMGALHDGHRSLIRAARLACDAVAVSIFVNPTQFAPTEDLSKYPRQLRHDQALCRREGVDVVFAPTVKAMYPEGAHTTVTVPALARRWEGEARPHHFQGVATVVTKLLSLVQPDIAWFGQKDYQQAMVVRQLVADLNLPGRIVVHPTVREADGLALSSRNVYLTQQERQAAPVLYRALQAGASAIRTGERRGAAIQRLMIRTVAREPLARVDYLAVCHPTTLEPLATIERHAVLLGVIRIGTVRLLDNLLVTARHRS